MEPVTIIAVAIGSAIFVMAAMLCVWDNLCPTGGSCGCADCQHSRRSSASDEERDIEGFVTYERF